MCFYCMMYSVLLVVLLCSFSSLRKSDGCSGSYVYIRRWSENVGLFVICCFHRRDSLVAMVQ